MDEYLKDLMIMAQWIKKMVSRKMGRHWSTKERWQVSGVWKKIYKFFKQKISKMRTPCKSHTDDKLAKGLCCQTKKSCR
jgi:hypothetical protein